MTLCHIITETCWEGTSIRFESCAWFKFTSCLVSPTQTAIYVTLSRFGEFSQASLLAVTLEWENLFEVSVMSENKCGRAERILNKFEIHENSCFESFACQILGCNFVDDDVDNFLRKIWTFSYELGFHVVELQVDVEFVLTPIELTLNVDARWLTVGIYSRSGHAVDKPSGVQNFEVSSFSFKLQDQETFRSNGSH